ncbi:MAG TPA: hypothetical protein VFU35_04630 [Jatrophihabitans sp.]|nr:hypothetical protein [Jatrophihabitans sp.]
MSARDALLERAKKASDASRYQVHVYIGANDYLYEQVRRGPGSLSNVSDTLTEIAESYAPSKIRDAVQERVAAARQRREQFAGRGETIAADWHQATAVKDANALIKTVRDADGAADLAKSLKTWLVDFPPAEVQQPVAKPARKPAASPARKTTARKTTARKTAATKPVRAQAATTPVRAEATAKTAAVESTD